MYVITVRVLDFLVLIGCLPWSRSRADGLIAYRSSRPKATSKASSVPCQACTEGTTFCTRPKSDLWCQQHCHGNRYGLLCNPTRCTCSGPLPGHGGTVAHHGPGPGGVRLIEQYRYRPFLTDNTTTCIAKYFDGAKIRFQPRSAMERLLLCRWIRRDNWEASTFRVFKEFISHNTAYISFGAWVGPMALYAAHLSHIDIYAFEPDPDAYAALKLNLRLNAKLSKRIRAYHRCVHAKAGSTVLYASSHGDSTSSLLPDSTGVLKANTTMTSVTCIEMDEFIQRYKIRPPYFFKVDVEGFEQVLIPSWYDMLQRLSPQRVVLFISIHQHVVGPFPPEAVDGFRRVFQLFRYVFEVSNGTQTVNVSLHERRVQPGTQFTLCQSCDYVLTPKLPRGTFVDLGLLDENGLPLPVIRRSYLGPPGLTGTTGT
eukprot:NODE_187_length_1679_cov_183.001840_g125_i1.p1 GENE.NODE_187_length_1679_cov_183.001840_g125_i1~~NODE_187_length_1679_cov_183.001840_g125_i1.p1  ORF type:complete len:426 (+),score=102.28 NODE_187_length_1679_cov_183.001840_g125_i1:239-1516(+)